ncbi:hypothetical protein [Paenibacillus apiarius]|uniref:hypothetical protein n=1 Tax=Paenibacillus apiarius TaxID=46240 RepID=UPI003B3B760A
MNRESAGTTSRYLNRVIQKLSAAGILKKEKKKIIVLGWDGLDIFQMVCVTNEKVPANMPALNGFEVLSSQAFVFAP